ncbi:MAG: hypothetical protein IJT87_00305 [Ruminiclostridium sp.]|nr:hypothetical protein [Ruminiclostridium sp.]
MGYSDAAAKIDRSYEQGTLYYNPSNKTKEPVDFGKVIRRAMSDNAGVPNNEESSSVSAGAAIDMLSVMAQMKDPYSLDTLDIFEESEELDSSMGFDEIAELDEIADDDAAKAEMEASMNVFGNTNVFDELFTDDDDLSAFEDIEDIV